MRNRMYGGVRGRKTKVGRKLLRFPPTRLSICILAVRVRNLIGRRTESDRVAYGIGIDNERER